MVDHPDRRIDLRFESHTMDSADTRRMEYDAGNPAKSLVVYFQRLFAWPCLEFHKVVVSDSKERHALFHGAARALCRIDGELVSSGDGRR